MPNWRTYIIWLTLWQIAASSAAQELPALPLLESEVRFSTESPVERPAPAQPGHSLDAAPRLPMGIEQKSAEVPGTRQSEVATKRRLPPPSKPREQQRLAPSNKTSTGSFVGVFGSLLFVLALFLVVTWFIRKTMPQASQTLPSEALEILGRAPLTQREQLHLIRLGNKLVLLSVSQTAVQPLTEITDPNEVERLTAITSRNQPGSVTETFRDVLTQMGSEPAPAGFLGNPPAEEEASPRSSEKGGKLHVEI
jgi:flagellar biogenesis protein FliO